uniref:RING-type domain-containing protein n=1 Tax=Parastrongyloides trichosuri TaxID=131310 RepID=A0A0N4Z267_PARTI
MNKLIKEITCLQDWSLSTASINQENSPIIDDALVYSLPYVPKNNFKIAVTKDFESIVTVTPDRVMKVNVLKDDKLTIKSIIKLKQDILHDQAILQYSDSNQLILITRSFGFLDIFDVNGVFKNTIKLVDNSKNVFDSISCIQSIKLEDDPWMDKVFMLQCNRNMICTRIAFDGKTEAIFTVQLNTSRYINSFHYISRVNLLITSSVFFKSKNINNENASIIDNYGIDIYRNTTSDSESFSLYRGTNKCVKKLDSLLGLFTFFYKIESIVSFASNADQTYLAFVTNFGKVIISSIPSMKIINFIDSEFLFKDMNLFVSISWNKGKEINLLLNNGDIYQKDFDLISEEIISGTVKVSLDHCLAICGENEGKINCFCGTNESDLYPLNKDNKYSSISLFFVFFLWVFTFFQKIYLLICKCLHKEIVNDVIRYESKKIDLSINCVRNTTFDEYLKKLLSQKNYEKAKELSKEHNLFDIDNINKLQWNDAKEPSDELLNILHEIKDKEWVVNECLKCNFSNCDFHLKLLEICNTLRSVVSEELQFHISHHNLIFRLGEWDDMDKFNTVKYMSLLDLGIYLFQDEQISWAKKLIKSYKNLLKSYILVMLLYIPESVNPRQYGDILPEMKENEEDPYLFLNNYEDKDIEFIDKEKELISNTWDRLMEDNVFVIPYYLEGKNQHIICRDWLIKRVLLIDERCGLANYSMRLSEIGTERGYVEMEAYIMHCYFYLQYLLKFNGGMTSTLEIFMNMDSDVIVKSVIKHMSLSCIIENIPLLVKIFSYFEGKNENSSAEQDMASIIEYCSETSLTPLDVMVSNFPNFLEYKSIERCFYACKLKGKALIDACQRYNIQKEIISALVIFNRHGVTPQFSQIIEARINSGKAWNFLMMLIRSSECLTEQQWKYIIMDVNDIGSILFTNVLTIEKVNQLLLEEMIELIEKVPSNKIPIHLIKNLSEEKIAQIILSKSNHYLNMSLPNINDENLVFAEKVLDLFPQNISKNEYELHKNHLNKVKLALELGSKKIPAQIIFCECREFLRELISINDNYKKFSKILTLGNLFNIDDSNNIVMALCTERALEREDIHTLKSYVEQLKKTSRKNSTVFKICKNIWKSKILKNMNEELMACMLMNCCDENDIEETFCFMNNN